MKDSVKPRAKIINFRIIFFGFLSLLFGIMVARELYRGGIEKIIITSVVLLVVIVSFCYARKFKTLIAILCLFLVGNGLYFLSIKTFDDVKFYEGRVSIVGRVTDDIESGNYGETIVIDNVKINGEKGRKIEVYIQNSFDKVKAGDVIAFESGLERVKAFNLRNFNSSCHRNGVRYKAEVSGKSITIIDSGKVNFGEMIRLKVKENLFKHMSERNAGLCYAVLFGGKNEVDSNVYGTFKNVGIIHLLTVSGLHVSFLVTIFYGLLNKCHVNRYVRLFITSIFIIFYAYLCGFSPAVMRASIMAIVYITAKSFYKNYDVLNSLGVAGFIILLIKPLYALDVGYLMSCFTVFAIVMLTPGLTKLFSKFLPKKIAGLVALSISAQIGILPFLGYFGSQVHLLAFIINSIVVPIFGILYPFLFVVSMLGTFIPFINYLLILVDLTFDFIVLVAQFFEKSGLSFPITAQYFGVTILMFAGVFALSDFMMVDGFKKFLIFSIVSLALAFSIGIYHIPIKEKRSIVVLSSGSKQSLVLNNRAGESLVVGYDYSLLNYSRSYNHKNMNYFVSNSKQFSGKIISSCRPLGIDRFFAFGGIVEEDDYTLLVAGESVKVGGFEIEYESFEEKIVGTTVKMDNICIFIANDNNLSYNIIKSEILPKVDPDIVFVDGQVIDEGERDFLLVTLDRCEMADYSSKANGNFKLCYGGKGFTMRGID